MRGAGLVPYVVGITLAGVLNAAALASPQSRRRIAADVIMQVEFKRLITS